MILNARYNNFAVYFEKGWVPEEITNKYQKVLDSLFFPFASIEDYLAYTVQTLSIPSLFVEQVQQLYKKYKYGWFVFPNREVSIEMRITDGYLNYFIIQDIIEWYYRLGNKNEKTFLPRIYGMVFDSEGYIILSMSMDYNVIKELSEIRMSYANNAPQFMTFSLSLFTNVLSINTSEYDLYRY